MNSRLLITTAFVLFIANGCTCDEEFEYLTLGVGAGSATSGPRWNETWTMQAPTVIVTSAIWGPNDVAPAAAAFELWRYDGEVAEQIELETSTCSTTNQPRTGPCKNFDYGGSCPYEGREWRSNAPLEEGQRYALVFRPQLGNGKPLSVDAEPQSFGGSDGLVMEILIE